MRDWRGWSSDTLDLQRPRPPPFRTGDRTGRGGGGRGGDPVEPPHLAYPSRRTFACAAAKLMAGRIVGGRVRHARYQRLPHVGPSRARTCMAREH